MHLIPCSRRAGTSSMATPYGVATITKSRSLVSEILSVNLMSVYPLRNPWTEVTSFPALEREVRAANSMSGCLQSRRESSLPV